jgi:hypothetical protein
MWPHVNPLQDGAAVPKIPPATVVYVRGCGGANSSVRTASPRRADSRPKPQQSCSPVGDFRESHPLHCLPGTLLPFGPRQDTRPSSFLSTCQNQSCLRLLILSSVENTLIYQVRYILSGTLRIAFVFSCFILACLFLSFSSIRFNEAAQERPSRGNAFFVHPFWVFL